MSLVQRLSLGQKFMVLGALALCMVLLPTGIYMLRVSDDISFAKKEVSGAGPLVALNKVIQLTQTHRGMSAGMLNGNQALAGRRPALRDATVKAMEAMDAQFAKAGVSAAIKSHWDELSKQWRGLEPAVAAQQIKAPESTKRHTQLIAGYLLLSEELLDEFGLSLDPDADTYYLLRAGFVNAPLLAENLGVMRALGSGFLTQAALPPEGRATLQGLQKRVLELQGEMVRNIKKTGDANPAIKASLQARSDAAMGAVVKTMAMADQGLLSATEIKMPATEYFDDFTRTIDGLFEFNGLATDSLTVALNARRASLERAALLTILALLAGAMVSAALGLYFVRSITGPVAEAVAVARSVAQGDLRTDITVRGTNELGQLMQALFDMNHSLANVVTSVRRGAEGVATASADIAQGNNDLSARWSKLRRPWSSWDRPSNKMPTARARRISLP